MNRLLALLLILAACSSAPRPPGAPKGLVDAAPLRTDWTPEQLQASCAEAEKTSDAKLAEVVGIPDAQRTFANTPEAIEQITADWSEVVSRAGFMKNIHLEEKVRAAAAACEEEAGKYAARLASRKDLYLAIEAWQGKKEPVGPQQARLVEIAMRDFHRAGVDLPEEKRAGLVKLRERIAELQTRFSTNLAEDTTSIEMAPEELEGMPESYLSRLKKGEGGRFIVTTKYPDYFPFMENARRTEARRKLETAFMNRGAKHNLQLLDEAIALRDQGARLLGYPTHADYVTEIQMAKNARTVREFEDKLQTRLRERLASDTAKMSAMKLADTGDPKIRSWDWRYYLNQLRKRDYALDDEQIRAYFPADKVMSGMFEVYSTLLGVQFRRAPDAKVWADGVSLYAVRDALRHERGDRLRRSALADAGELGVPAGGAQAPLVRARRRAAPARADAAHRQGAQVRCGRQVQPASVPWSVRPLHPHAWGEGGQRRDRAALVGGDHGVPRGPAGAFSRRIRAHDGRLRRRVLRVSLERGVRRGSVHPFRAGGSVEPEYRPRLPQHHPGEREDGRSGPAPPRIPRPQPERRRLPQADRNRRVDRE